MENITNTKGAFINDEAAYNKKISSKPVPEKNIGIDTHNTLLSNIVEGVENSLIDTSVINSFTQVSERRNEIYDLIDSMANDPLMAAALETYAEDATEYNDQGKIVWAESADPNVLDFITYLLDTMNVDKNINPWAQRLCKYGDIYLRLVRESDFEDLYIYDRNKDTKEQLNEAVRFNSYHKNDKYSHYVDVQKNPAEIFELTKYGKTVGYIKTKVGVQSTLTDQVKNGSFQQFQQYNFNQNDVDIFPATEFVHGCLEDTSSRTEEEVKIFLDNDIQNADGETEVKSITYSVKRGQSLFYNIFKVWRQLSLLENSVILNRLTKSSIVRIVQMEVGDMPKDDVRKTLNKLKEKVEQKTALDKNTSMSEYNNPGSVENTIYIPTNGGKGAISTSELGGNPEVSSLLDLDYFKNKLWSALRIPKQFMGDTEDAAGFSGGESLAQISSRYAKEIKKIQNTLCQMITDACNLMCIDKGLDSYVGRFTIRMQAPSTVEEAARRDDLNAKVGNVRDIMDLLADVDNPSIKLKVLKALLSNVITNEDVITYIQEAIDALEAEQAEGGSAEEVPDELSLDDTGASSSGSGGDSRFDFESEAGEAGEATQPNETEEETTEEPAQPEEGNEQSLPNPQDLGVDFTDNEG